MVGIMKKANTMKNFLRELIKQKKILLLLLLVNVISCGRNTGISDYCLLDSSIKNTCPTRREYRQNRKSIKHCKKTTKSKDKSKEYCLREVYPAKFDTEKICRLLDKHNNDYDKLCD